MGGLLARKMLVAFIVSAIPPILAFATSVAPDWKVTHEAWVTLAAAVVGATSRGLLALSPLNLVPSDAEHTLKSFRG